MSIKPIHLEQKLEGSQTIVNSIKDLLLDVELIALQSWPMIDMYKDSVCIKKVLLDGVRPVNHGEKRAPDGRSCLSIWIFWAILMSSCARL